MVELGPPPMRSSCIATVFFIVACIIGNRKWQPYAARAQVGWVVCMTNRSSWGLPPAASERGKHCAALLPGSCISCM